MRGPLGRGSLRTAACVYRNKGTHRQSHKSPMVPRLPGDSQPCVAVTYCSRWEGGLEGESGSPHPDLSCFPYIHIIHIYFPPHPPFSFWELGAVNKSCRARELSGIGTLKKAGRWGTAEEPSSRIRANSADAKRGINARGAARALGQGALTRMNGIIPSEW